MPTNFIPMPTNFIPMPTNFIPMPTNFIPMPANITGQLSLDDMPPAFDPFSIPAAMARATLYLTERVTPGAIDHAYQLMASGVPVHATRTLDRLATARFILMAYYRRNRDRPFWQESDPALEPMSLPQLQMASQILRGPR
jgi:hypothetical protein